LSMSTAVENGSSSCVSRSTCSRIISATMFRSGWPRASTETARRAEDAMGYTPGGGDERGRLAFVMINRVNQIADGYSTPRPVVLALAIAHELGHLLLSREHSATGIMKAVLNQADFRNARNGDLTFTEEQAQRLRAGIEKRR
jgi:hypothetical protein